MSPTSYLTALSRNVCVKEESNFVGSFLFAQVVLIILCCTEQLYSQMAPRVGVEPTFYKLTVCGIAIMLPRKKVKRIQLSILLPIFDGYLGRAVRLTCFFLFSCLTRVLVSDGLTIYLVGTVVKQVCELFFLIAHFG